MTIRVIQSCDSCREERTLTDARQEQLAGWRGVSGGKHLCNRCISSLLEKP